jgi:RNA polymerase sigma-70 factor (ECF subfamily)
LADTGKRRNGTGTSSKEGVKIVRGEAAKARQPALLDEALRGDARAFVDLIRSFDHSFRRLAYRLLGDRHELDDVLQEAYTKAFAALPRFRGDSALQTWLYRIVYNACLDQLKRQRPETTALEPELDAAAADPADLVATRSALADALAALAPVERAVVLLVDADGLSYDDAAAIVGVPAGTIASRLSRARASLRRSLRTNREGVAT